MCTDCGSGGADTPPPGQTPPPPEQTHPIPHPSPCGQTDAYVNITDPILRSYAVGNEQVLLSH